MLQKGYTVDITASIQEELAKKSVHKSKGISPPLLLTYPMKDLEGDYVEPEGGVWADDCYVNWDHQHPIGCSVGKPELMTTTIQGKSVKLPVGYSRFYQKASDYNGVDLNIRNDAGKVIGKYDRDECLQIAEQAEKLVNNRIVTGVSMEFIPKVAVPIGPSAMRSNTRGKAFHVQKWNGYGWAHTPLPINPGAQMLVEKGIKVIEDNTLHAVIKKSFANATKYQNKSWSNGVSLDSEDNMQKKATTYDPQDFDPEFEDKGAAVSETPPAQDMPAEPADKPESPSDDNQPRGAVKAKLDFAQGLMDLCTRFAMDMKNSDNPAAMKVMGKLKSEAERLAQKAMGHAEKLHTELQGKSTADDESGNIESDPMDDEEVGGESVEQEESESPEHEASETKEEEKAEHEDDEIDMDETGKIKPKSFPNFQPKYRLAPMKKTDFKEFAEYVSKKSTKSNTDKLVAENAELKLKLTELESEHERALELIGRVKVLRDLGKY